MLTVSVTEIDSMAWIGPLQVGSSAARPRIHVPRRRSGLFIGSRHAFSAATVADLLYKAKLVRRQHRAPSRCRRLFLPQLTR